MTTHIARRQTMGDLLRRSAARHPDRTAIVDGDLRRTYRELDDAVNRAANALAERGWSRATGSRCSATTRTASSSRTSRARSSA